MQQKELTAKQKEMNRVHHAVYEKMLQNAVPEKEGALPVDFLSERLTFYINHARFGIFDVQDALEADNVEFFQMAYYSMLGVLPGEDILSGWRKKAEKPAWDFRKEVLDTLLSMPEAAVKNIIVRNNIYGEGMPNQKGRKQSLKQRILFGGYQLSRRLPDGIKVPLKKIAMKILMK